MLCPLQKQSDVYCTLVLGSGMATFELEQRCFYSVRTNLRLILLKALSLLDSMTNSKSTSDSSQNLNTSKMLLDG